MKRLCYCSWVIVACHMKRKQIVPLRTSLYPFVQHWQHNSCFDVSSANDGLIICLLHSSEVYGYILSAFALTVKHLALIFSPSVSVTVFLGGKTTFEQQFCVNKVCHLSLLHQSRGWLCYANSIGAQQEHFMYFLSFFVICQYVR